jgi:hypothetical protein
VFFSVANKKGQTEAGYKWEISQKDMAEKLERFGYKTDMIMSSENLVKRELGQVVNEAGRSDVSYFISESLGPKQSQAKESPFTALLSIFGINTNYSKHLNTAGARNR